MDTEQGSKATRKYFIKQAILLVVTVVLLIYFTFPLLRTIKATINPEALLSSIRQTTEEEARIQNKLEVTQAKVLMAPGDSETEAKLKKDVEELKSQLALEKEKNKSLQDQMILVNTMLEVFKAKAPANDPGKGGDKDTVAWTQKIVELLAKVIGCVGSVYSGTMFIVGWLRKRKEGQPTAVA